MYVSKNGVYPSISNHFDGVFTMRNIDKPSVFWYHTFRQTQKVDINPPQFDGWNMLKHVNNTSVGRLAIAIDGAPMALRFRLLQNVQGSLP